MSHFIINHQSLCSSTNKMYWFTCRIRCNIFWIKALILFTQKYLAPTRILPGGRYYRWISDSWWHRTPIFNRLTNQGTEIDHQITVKQFWKQTEVLRKSKKGKIGISHPESCLGPLMSHGKDMVHQWKYSVYFKIYWRKSNMIKFHSHPRNPTNK